MINSMTVEERRNPDLLASSPGRIAGGAGYKEADVGKLVSDFQKMRSLQQMGQGGFPGMPGMFGGMGNSYSRLKSCSATRLAATAAAAKTRKEEGEKKKRLWDALKGLGNRDKPGLDQTSLRSQDSGNAFLLPLTSPLPLLVVKLYIQHINIGESALT